MDPVTLSQNRPVESRSRNPKARPTSDCAGKEPVREERLLVCGSSPASDQDRHHKVKLCVRRVFIMDSAEELLPAYLRFVRGIVDSSDLPLNVSRELLQQSSDVAEIRGASVKRVLGLIEDLGDNQKEKYATFWGEFGVLKEGFIEDS